VLELEQREQQLGKQWHQWVNHLQSPDYASDDPLPDGGHPSRANGGLTDDLFDFLALQVSSIDTLKTTRGEVFLK